MNIGVDIDDVLANFHAVWIDYHNVTYGTTVKFEEFSDYDYRVSFNLPGDVIFPRVHDFYETEVFESILPIPGSVERIQMLSQLHNLVAITARPDSTIPSTLRWMKKYYGDCFSNIEFCNHFSREEVFENRPKSDICKMHNIKIMIEDAKHNALDVASCGTKVLLLDRPWNRDLPAHDNIVRVWTWDDIYNHINNLEE